MAKTAEKKDNEKKVCQYCGKPKEKKTIGTGEHTITLWVDTCSCVEDMEQAEEQRKKNLARFCQ